MPLVVYTLIGLILAGCALIPDIHEQPASDVMFIHPDPRVGDYVE